MTTVIDSLVLEFALDPSKFTKGQKQVLIDLKQLLEGSKATGKEVESTGAKMGQFFGSLKQQVLGLTAVFLGGKGIKEFVSFVTTLDNATGKIARVTQQTPQAISQWAGAITQMGGAAESAGSAISGLTEDMEDFLAGRGGGQQFQLLNRLGIKPGRDANTTLLNLLTAIEGITKREGPAHAASLLRSFPGMNQDMINLFVSGRARTLLEDAKKNVPSDDDIARATKFTAELDRLERAGTNLGRTFLTEVAPALSATAEAMERVMTQMSKDFHTPTTPQQGNENRGWLNDIAAAASGMTLGGLPFLFGRKAGEGSIVTNAVLQAIKGVNGITAVTSLNDSFHKNLGGAHPAGRGVDLTIADASKSAATAAAIRASLAAAGISANVIDEYQNRSKNWTGGHIHIGVTPGGAQTITGAIGASGVTNRSTTNRGGDTATTSVQIGQINVDAKGGDADSIARSIDPALRRTWMGSAANFGLQ